VGCTNTIPLQIAPFERAAEFVHPTRFWCIAVGDGDGYVVEHETSADAKLLLRAPCDVASAKGHVRRLICDTAVAFAVGTDFSWP
jgi:hypothetical protein